MLPKQTRKPVSTVFAGDFCSNSEECGNGFLCRKTLLSKRAYGMACVPEETCEQKNGFVVTLYNELLKFKTTYEALDNCIPRKIVDYSVGEGGGCRLGKHCKNGLQCMPVFDSKLKRNNAICISEAQCAKGKDQKFTLNKIEYKSLKAKCMDKPKLNIVLGQAADTVCTKTEQCQ